MQRWIGEGLVKVNGAAAGKPSSRVATGDEIEVFLPLPPPPRPGLVAEEAPVAILYEDEHLLAVDKPPGLVVHPTHGYAGGTLANALLWLARDWGEGARPGLVNRLDKGTSGVLLVAKRPEIHAALSRALRARGAEKEYLAVVYGRTPFAKGRIDLKILRDPEDRRRMSASKTEGRDSATLYERLAETPEDVGALSLVRCVLLTGRTHQIRVHLESQGLPIVGDPVYGAPRWKGIGAPELAALCRDFPRQALHARRLVLAHPVTGATLEVVAPVPEDLGELLAAAGLGG